MPSRKLLMLINFFPPAGGGGVYRPLSFVKYLSRMGWDITVVTPKPGEFWISDPSLERADPRGCTCHKDRFAIGGQDPRGLKGGRAGQPAGARSSGGFEAMRKAGEFFLLPDTYIGWRPFAVRTASRLCREEMFDALYSTSPPDSTQLAAHEDLVEIRNPVARGFQGPVDISLSPRSRLARCTGRSSKVWNAEWRSGPARSQLRRAGRWMNWRERYLHATRYVYRTGTMRRISRESRRGLPVVPCGSRTAGC